MKKYLVVSWATLVRAGKAVFTIEEQTENEERVVPESYTDAVAEYLIEKFGV